MAARGRGRLVDEYELAWDEWSEWVAVGWKAVRWDGSVASGWWSWRGSGLITSAWVCASGCLLVTHFFMSIFKLKF